MNDQRPKPVVLVILDGWGVAKPGPTNGIDVAQTPNYDHFVQTYPYTTLQASGEAVGLPKGQMGNSEVGHMTIGTGAVIYQDLVRIDHEIASGQFEHNPAIAGAIDHVRQHDSQLHVIGLLSCGGVHSHENHLFETIRVAAKKGVKKLVVHAFLDGRDCSRTEGQDSLGKLEALLHEIGVGAIATMSGRYWSMDRDKNWDRTDKAFNAIWHGTADLICPIGDTPSNTASSCYARHEYDEMIEPYIIHKPDGTAYTVNQHDGIIFTNFRPDRARQLSQKIGEQVQAMDLNFVTMTDYGIDCHNIVAYSPVKVATSLAEIIAEAGLKQIHIAETEKYAHATYFLNGGQETAHNGEEFLLIPSNKEFKTPDLAPEMRAQTITDTALEKLDSTDFIFVNYANADMVGHTANQPAIIEAVETLDVELGRLVKEVLAHNGALFISADHGNAEQMVDPVTGEAHTAHTANPVPCIVIENASRTKLRDGGGLKDVAPTILDMLKLEPPSSMTGQSLIEQEQSH